MGLIFNKVRYNGRTVSRKEFELLQAVKQQDDAIITAFEQLAELALQLHGVQS